MDESPPIADMRRAQRGTAGGLRTASWAYVVVAVAVALLWVVAKGASGFSTPVGFGSPLAIITAFASVLVGAAFHARHADAWAAHRPIALAIALSAAASVVYPVTAILLEYGALATAFGRGGPGVVEWSFAGNVAASLLLSMSMALLWIGIRRERREADGPNVRAISLGIWILAGLLLLSSTPVIAYGVRLGSFDLRAYILGTFAINAIQSLLSAGVTVALVAGARSGERPGRAWRVAGVTRVIVLIASLALPALMLVAGPLVSDAGVIIGGTALIGLIGTLGLLAGFALGLPSDDRPQAGTPS